MKIVMHCPEGSKLPLVGMKLHGNGDDVGTVSKVDEATREFTIEIEPEFSHLFAIPMADYSIGWKEQHRGIESD